MLSIASPIANIHYNHIYRLRYVSVRVWQRRGDRAPPPSMDGSSLDCESFGVYDGMKESGLNTMGTREDWKSNTDAGNPDFIENSLDIRRPRIRPN
jgi:hypothetical protein